MSEGNVELVRRVNAVGSTGDWNAVVEMYHDDVEWRDLQHAPDAPEVVRGKAAVAALGAQWSEAFGELKHDVFGYIDVGPWVICDSHWRATGKGSQLEIDQRCADAYEVREGKVARAVLGYADVATALKALGLEE